MRCQRSSYQVAMQTALYFKASVSKALSIAIYYAEKTHDPVYLGQWL